MRLCGQTFTAGILERIRDLVANEAGLSRSTLSRQVCDWLDWRGANGRVQEVSSRKALGELARRGLIELPPVRGLSAAGLPGGGRPALGSALLQRPAGHLGAASNWWRWTTQSGRPCGSACSRPITPWAVAACAARNSAI